jgi:hypothetical protein
MRLSNRWLYSGVLIFGASVTACGSGQDSTQVSAPPSDTARQKSTRLLPARSLDRRCSTERLQPTNPSE